ncbi:hypothetical protein B0H63DRAFT_103148 [Podospora didyma]|uniref:F-box domain-containing protein n=1 Tax=Podospora didyma TaxID=330526 RepID=A0AAE0U3Y0_9PEZI|nr:hypothetical protein B0H63DRAFT_103148 [Podospora didyma]
MCSFGLRANDILNDHIGRREQSMEACIVTPYITHGMRLRRACFCAVCGGPMTRMFLNLRRPPREPRPMTEWESRLEGAPKLVNRSRDPFYGYAFTHCYVSDIRRLPHNRDCNVCYNTHDIKTSNVGWTRELRVLGLNLDLYRDNNSPAYLSGRAKYTKGQCIVLDVPSCTDENFPIREVLPFNGNADLHQATAYAIPNKGIFSPPVFPMHTCCLDILTEVLTGTNEPDNIDKDLLFATMYKHRKEFQLDLDYGPISGCQGVGWQVGNGQQFSVANPTYIAPTLEDKLRSIIESSPNHNLSADLNLSLKVLHDPFRKLPYDVLHHIAHLLPAASVFRLCSASWTVHSTLRRNAMFWRSHARHTSMPWFKELTPFLMDDELTAGKDIATLLSILNNKTKAKIYMEGPLIFVANRRRIWELSERLASLMANNDRDTCIRFARAQIIAERSDYFASIDMLVPDMT